MWIASLAPLVFAEAETHDPLATSIVATAAAELGGLVVSVTAQLHMDPEGYPLALAGGALVHAPPLHQSVQQWLAQHHHRPGTCRTVADPVSGSVILARRLYSPAPGPTKKC